MHPAPRYSAKLYVVLGILCIVCFVGGMQLGTMGSPRPGTLSARLTKWFSSVQPGRPAEAASVPDLKSVETLWEVLDSLKKHYVEESLDQTKLTDGAIRGLLAELGDRHTRYMDAKEYREFQLQNAGEFDGIGATLEAIEDEKTGDEWLVIKEPLDGSPAMEAGVRAGDRIVGVDGKSTKGMSLDEAVTLIRGPRDTKVVLTLERKGKDKPFDVEITRRLIELSSVTSEMLEGGVGHVMIAQFNSKTEEMLDGCLEDLKKQGLKALVVDVRDDPGGLLDAAVGVASRFIKKGTIVVTRGRDGEEDLTAIPGKFADLKVPLCVLVNQHSASASEILAGAIQDHKLGKIIGAKTYGKASVQVVITLKNRGALALTTAKYFTPDDRDISKTGIIPDIEVEMTDEDYQEKRDPQLARAVEELKRARAVAGATGAGNRRTGA